MRRLYWLLIALIITACASYPALDNLYGPADPSRYDNPIDAEVDLSLDYQQTIKPTLENRCVVCHGCYDAPCQLNLNSYEGITRGAHKDKVYYSARLAAANPARLFIDAKSNEEWRERGFYPVLNEHNPSAENNRNASVMHRLLDLKRETPWGENEILDEAHYDFALDRSQSCPKLDELNSFEQKHPDWGMPYGLPPLSDEEHTSLTQWLQAGAPYTAPQALDQSYIDAVAQWEHFLNGDDLKSQLMSRYIYEHWFIANLYFDQLPLGEVFKLVRSKTPPGQAVDIIATRRPTDDPEVDRVYYRLVRQKTGLLAKTHMPYVLNAKRMHQLQTWFIDREYTVSTLPSYKRQDASNPFLTFVDIPVESRYRFMLEEAQFTIMGYIKGPVCRGQVAVNVINDHFWVVFVDPDLGNVGRGEEFLTSQIDNLKLPARKGSNAGALGWIQHAQTESAYLRAKTAFINEVFDDSNPPNLSLIWDGEGTNPNAALTIFRHFDSATVVKGFVGEAPQTAWVIDYPMLERLHYLLVAGFDVYGNVAHQLDTRLFMDFLRMEGEFNFIAFLPAASRDLVRDQWYRDAPSRVRRYINGCKAFYTQETGIDFNTAATFPEMLSLLKNHLAPALQNNPYAIANSTLDTKSQNHIRQLASLTGASLSFLPELAFLSVRDKQQNLHHFSLIRNSAHSNISHLFNDHKRRLINEDTLTVTHGFLGAYPNTFYLIEETELASFVSKLRQLASEEDYRNFANNYAIRRTDKRFWDHSDTLHAAYRELAPEEAGLFDYNRLENR